MEMKFHGGGNNEPFIVETIAPGGYLLESHKHKHGHTSVLVSGSADVTIDGVTRRFDGYSIISIPGDTVHSVRSVTDIVWLCIWSGDVAPIDQAIDSLKLVPA